MQPLEMQDQKNRQKIAIWTPLYKIFATSACIDSRKKLVKQQYLSHMPLQYGELLPTSGSDSFVSLEHPS